MIERLGEIEQDAVAITDHGRCLGSIGLYKKLKEAGIKYIHGCEVYICQDTSIRDKDNKYNHLLILCKDEIGRQNLNKLLSLSEHPTRFYSKPRIDFNLLSEYKDGLIVSSACLAGEIPSAIMGGDPTLAEEIANKYKGLLGEDFYLEIQSRLSEDQVTVNKQVVGIARKLGIGLVATSDAHYVWEKDKKYQAKYAFNGAYKEDGENYQDCYIQSEAEVREKLYYLSEDIINEAIENTHKISEKCNLEMPLSPPIMPHIDTPSEFVSNREWLENICVEGFRDKLNIDYYNHKLCDPDKFQKKFFYNEDGEVVGFENYQLTQDEINGYISRYEYELDSLARMEFIDYILLVYSYANKGSRRGIARGSGGGSLICYLTHITDIDPIEHGLYFERFIDVGALDLLESGQITTKELKLPDLDLDYSNTSRDEILRFLYNEYGEENVASIGRFGTSLTKGITRDMCKAFDFPLELEDKIAKSFEMYEINDIDMMLSGEIPTMSSAADAIMWIHKYPELFEYVRKLVGLPKSFGLHPCGRIISTRELDYFLPSCYDADGIRYLQGDMYDVEDVGLVKVDILGLRTIDQEYNTLELSGEDISFIDPKQDFLNPKVLGVFNKGDTEGVFQMSSWGMKKTIKQMNVQSLNELAVAIALYRPGPMLHIDSFCERRKGKEAFKYLHPDLEPILKNTYGIIVFQEQLIEIGRMAGLRNPDLIRQATAKKKPELLVKVKPELEEKFKSKGWTQEQFDQLWSDILEFAKYSFGKAHASAYAIIAYMTAKQKVYYPNEFYAGLMNSYIGKSDYVKEKAAIIFSDMSSHGVNLAPLNFRQDHRRCWVNNDRIIYAIPLIRDLSVSTAEALFCIKDKQFEYFWECLYELIHSYGVPKNQISRLVKLGFFHEFGHVKHLLSIIDIFTYFKDGTALRITKARFPYEGTPLEEILKTCSQDKNKDGSVSASYRITDMPSLLNRCELYIKEQPVTDFDLKFQIGVQQDSLGFAPIPTGIEGDRPKLYIREIFPVKRKKDGVRFGYNIVARSLGSGIENRYTVYNTRYNATPIDKGDIVLCRRWYRENGFLTLDSYDKLA